LFEKIRLKNYRAHVDTQLSLGQSPSSSATTIPAKPIFFGGGEAFSRLIAHARPDGREGNES